MKEIEVKREEMEGCLATLGTALCLIQLASRRVDAAVTYYGHERFLMPVIDDLATARNKVSQAQGMVRASCPQVFGGGE